MKKRTIPLPTDANRRMYDEAVKENLELIMGFRGGKIAKLPQDATQGEIIAKINELIGRLQ